MRLLTSSISNLNRVKIIFSSMQTAQLIRLLQRQLQRNLLGRPGERLAQTDPKPAKLLQVRPASDMLDACPAECTFVVDWLLLSPFSKIMSFGSRKLRRAGFLTNPQITTASP